MPEQAPPYAVQVELTRGCNLQCSFCGINGFQLKPNSSFRFMTPETADRVASQLAAARWNPRIEFARSGEPTLNPHIREIFAIFRRHLPKQQLMLTSNGAGIAKHLRHQGPAAVTTLFDAGLNILALDNYTGITFVPKIVEALAGAPVVLRQYPEDPLGNPHRRYRPGTRFVTVLQDIALATKGTHSLITNHAGFGGPLDPAYQGRCARPFRELSVNWDGGVDLCCIDWVGEYQIGNLHELTLPEIWQHERFQAARAFLYAGDRTALRPCAGCNQPSYRVGLLPDPMGKHPLPPPNADDLQLVQLVNGTRLREQPTPRARASIYASLQPHQQAAWDLRAEPPPATLSTPTT